MVLFSHHEIAHVICPCIFKGCVVTPLLNVFLPSDADLMISKAFERQKATIAFVLLPVRMTWICHTKLIPRHAAYMSRIFERCSLNL